MDDQPQPVPADAAVPDFERYQAVTQAYEDAKLRYIRSNTSAAELRLRDDFAKRRDEVNVEIAGLQEVFERHRVSAAASLRAYAERLPHRVRKGVIGAPSLWERVRSFNAVNRSYRAAQRSAADVEDVLDLLRKRRSRIDAMESETRRSIYLREEAVRKRLQTPEGLVALQSDPIVKAAYQKLQAANSERAYHDERIQTGHIPPQEARNEDMIRHGWTFASAPLLEVMIAAVARYGDLEYYVLRDGRGRESLLACDPALEALRDCVFDVARVANAYRATLRVDAAGSAVREPAERVTRKTPASDQVEEQLIAALVVLATRIRGEASEEAASDEAASEQTATG